MHILGYRKSSYEPPGAYSIVETQEEGLLERHGHSQNQATRVCIIRGASKHVCCLNGYCGGAIGNRELSNNATKNIIERTLHFFRQKGRLG